MGCSFEPGGSARAGSDSGPELPDAAVDVIDAAPPGDSAPPVCLADQTVCDGNVLQTCTSSGDGYVEDAAVICPLTCEDDARCTEASNITAENQRKCDGSGPALTPVAGTTVTIASGDGITMTCQDCGEGELVINAAGVQEEGTIDLAYFCLSEIDIPTGVTVTVDPNVAQAIALFADGSVNIAGTVSVAGNDGTNGSDDGAGGPGGFRGGNQSLLSAGDDGEGPCGGGGGGRDGSIGDRGAGGGGGGGHQGTGGDGGDGLSPTDGTVGDGGTAGLGDCGQADLIPLVGGSGGGGGADGTCGGTCGWAGGGGGGAIQIASRDSITVTVNGSVVARGGTGFGMANGSGSSGGAGGGGAGGAILLEAPTIMVTGSLDVTGGAGGPSGGGAGAAGAGDGEINGTAAGDADANGEGGPGGGGGGGRVRLNALAAPTCGAEITPADSCSSGQLTDIGIGQ